MSFPSAKNRMDRSKYTVHTLRKGLVVLEVQVRKASEETSAKLGQRS